MSGIRVDITGDKQVMAALQELGKYGKSSLTMAFKKVGAIIVKQARRNTKNVKNKGGDGFKGRAMLSKSIKAKVSKGKRAGIWIGPDHKIMNNAHWWEKGTEDRYSGGFRGRIKPGWYMHTAFKQKEREATNQLRTEIRKSVGAKARKYGLQTHGL